MAAHKFELGIPHGQDAEAQLVEPGDGAVALREQLFLADRPFDAWRFTEFTPPELGDPQISGAEADPDSDGIKNLEEYAFQLPPKISSIAGLPVVGRDLSGALTLSYTLLKSATDITCVAEVSTDLNTWHAGAGYTSVQTTDQGLTWSVVATSLLSPVAEPRQFMRVRITRP